MNDRVLTPGPYPILIPATLNPDISVPGPTTVPEMLHDSPDHWPDVPADADVDVSVPLDELLMLKSEVVPPAVLPAS